MTFPVLVVPTDGRFAASLIGAPEVRGEADSRAGALAALESNLVRRIGLGELTTVEIDPMPISSFAGLFRDDPELQVLCDEAYERRSAEASE